MARLARPRKTTTKNILTPLPENEPQQTIPSQSAPPGSDLNFDRMTVVQLRGYLRDCSVRVPSRARKQELLDLATEHRSQVSHVKSDEMAIIPAQMPDLSIDGLEITPDQAVLNKEPSQPTGTTPIAPTALDQYLEAMTIVDLRQYLEDYAIDIPSRARKPQLLQLVKEHHASMPDVQAGDLTTLSLSVQLSDLSIEGGQTVADLTIDAATNGSLPGASDEVDNDKPLPNIPNPTDDISYLQPSFNPTSLTVPKLRNLLAAHEVMYTKAKGKQDLIRLFEANITPRAAATIQAIGTIEKTDEGIIDA